ncbi:hypothetical protein KAW18_01925 [candidate division WOR-3 bacterium]|nr:hypothetical protein [candidate division WOR-3 bacterium]
MELLNKENKLQSWFLYLIEDLVFFPSTIILTLITVNLLVFFMISDQFLYNIQDDVLLICYVVTILIELFLIFIAIYGYKYFDPKKVDWKGRKSIAHLLCFWGLFLIAMYILMFCACSLGD